MHGVNAVGFNGRLGGRKRAERKAGEDKGKHVTFHGSFLSTLDLVFGFIDFFVGWHGRKSCSVVTNIAQAGASIEATRTSFLFTNS
jgi:hypothetical protein